MERIYYYKTVTGRWHFSNGAIIEDAKAGQYLRMLGKTRKDLYKLYLDIPSDFHKAKKILNLPVEARWQDIYYSND